MSVSKKNSFIANTLGRLGAIPAHFLVGTVNKIFKSPDIEEIQSLTSQLVAENSQTEDTHVRIDHEDIFDDFQRLKDSKVVSWPLKYTVGAVATVVSSLFSRFSRVDRYNPFTDTISLYNAHEAVARHELAHAEYFHKLDSADFWILAGMVPVLGGAVRLYEEFMANKIALDHTPDEDFRKINPVLERSFNTYFSAAAGGIGSFFGLPLVGGVTLATGWLASFIPKDFNMWGSGSKQSPEVTSGFQLQAA